MNPNERQSSGRAELRLAATVARSHYLDNRSKVQIAEELNLSRFKVARLLELARSEGIVTIQVRDPRGVDTELSESLRDALGIAHALVVDSDVEPRRQVGALAAEYLHDVVQANSSIGLAWSRSTQALAMHLFGLPRCTIVQLCGVIPNSTGEEHNVEIVRRAAQRVNANAVTFYAPLVVSTPATAAGLRSQPGIADALRRCGQLSIAVVAIGLWAAGESTVYDALPAQQCAAFTKRGAVAETCGILLDANGNQLRDGLQDRTIAISAAQLRRAGEVVALATDASRASAVVAMARSGMLSTLITHRELARRILAEAGHGQH